MGCGWAAARLLTEGFAPPRRSPGMFLGEKRRMSMPSRLDVGGAAGGDHVRGCFPISLWFAGFVQDVKESVLTYGSYLTRSGGVGHEKPWFYYVTMLSYRDVFVWSEAM